MKIFCTVSILLALCTNVRADEVAYANAESGFSLSRPSDWKEQPGNNPSIAVMFMSPLEGANDPFSENVNVVVKDLPPGTAAHTDINAIVDSAKPIVMKQLSGTEISDEHSTVDKLAARKIVMDAAVGGKPFRSTQWYVLSGDRMFVVTYAAQKDSPAALNAKADAIVASIRFTMGPTTTPAK